MSLSLILVKRIASLLFIVLAGYLPVKLKLLKASDSRCLSIVLLYIITPCVIVSAFEVEMTAEIRRGLLLAFCAAAVSQAILITVATVLARIFHFAPVERASVIYSNTGNLIIPLVTAVLGQEWVIYSIAYLCVQTFSIWSYGKAILSGDRRPNFRKMFLNINLICIIIGILFFITGFRLPPVVQDAADSVKAMIGPVAMLITGMLLAQVDFPKAVRNPRLWLCVVLRLVFCPLIIVSVLKFSPLSALAPNGKTILLLTLLASSSPSASTVTQMAQVFGNDAEYANAINIICILLCIVTMPLLVALYMM